MSDALNRGREWLRPLGDRQDPQTKLIRVLVGELADLESSFALYHEASMALMHAYKAAHPEVPENVWPDAGKVNYWAASELERLRKERA